MLTSYTIMYISQSNTFPFTPDISIVTGEKSVKLSEQPGLIFYGSSSSSNPTCRGVGRHPLSMHTGDYGCTVVLFNTEIQLTMAHQTFPDSQSIQVLLCFIKTREVTQSPKAALRHDRKSLHGVLSIVLKC